MVVGGLQKVSLSDYPGLISTIVFTQGCNFRCPWCHNPGLVDPSRFGPAIPWECVIAFLRLREGQIGGIVVTGGEPTVHADLPDRLAELKHMGFKIKLDTNGSNPDMLRRLLDSGLVDFISMDVKAPLHRYAELVGAGAFAYEVAASISMVLGSQLPHEFRTTLVPGLSMEDLQAIAELVQGCNRFVLQEYRAGRTLVPGYADRATPAAELRAAAGRLAGAGLDAIARL